MIRQLVFSLAWVLLSAGTAWAGLPETINKLKPSIVLVGTYKATNNPRFQLRGSGFIVGDGTKIVTNAHVLPEQGSLQEGQILVAQLRLGQGGEWQMRPVTHLETDPAHDLSLLQMDGPAAPAIAIGDSSRVREGDDLAFMGFPIGGILGFSIVTHRAMVSSITTAALPSPSAGRLSEKAILGLRNGTFPIFQLDATAYPGNSGGPLFDPVNGELVGVLNMVLIKGTRESALSQPSGIAYAIPSSHVKDLLQKYR